MDCRPPGSSIHGIFQARVLEWGAIALSTNAYWRYVIVPLFYFHNRKISNALILPSFASASCSNIHLTFLILHSGASQMVLVVKNPPANAGDARDAGSIPGSGRSLGEGMATHSSILAWRMSWTEKSGGLQSTRSHRVGHNWSDLARMHALATLVLQRTKFSHFMAKDSWTSATQLIYTKESKIQNHS